jgi:drug/metabolite transporter (DMT)-like permease
MKTTSYGSLWMLVAGLFFAIMGVCVKLGAARYSSAELVFYRSLFGFLTILAILLISRQSFATPLWKAHLSRGISGFVALMLFFYAITALPLATAITLNYTAPLFLAAFTTLLLREPIKPLLLGAIVLGFLGVALLLGPTLHREELLAGILGLASGLIAGFAYLQVSQLGRMGEPEWRTVFYFTLVCTLGSGLWMLAQDFHQVALADLPLLVGMGASATLAQLAMTRAYRKGDPLVAGSLAYSTVVLASLFGIALWGETLSMESWLGIVLIILSGVISVRFGPSALPVRI